MTQMFQSVVAKAKGQHGNQTLNINSAFNQKHIFLTLMTCKVVEIDLFKILWIDAEKFIINFKMLI